MYTFAAHNCILVMCSKFFIDNMMHKGFRDFGACSLCTPVDNCECDCLNRQVTAYIEAVHVCH